MKTLISVWVIRQRKRNVEGDISAFLTGIGILIGTIVLRGEFLPIHKQIFELPLTFYPPNS